MAAAKTALKDEAEKADNSDYSANEKTADDDKTEWESKKDELKTKDADLKTATTDYKKACVYEKELSIWDDVKSWYEKKDTIVNRVKSNAENGWSDISGNYPFDTNANSSLSSDAKGFYDDFITYFDAMKDAADSDAEDDAGNTLWDELDGDMKT